VTLPTFRQFLDEAAARRSRSSWNERLTHWERPASDSEEAKIQRAAAMVRAVLNSNAWTKAEGITIEPQGSYYNNTNVRQEADLDLRAVHPHIYAEYQSNVVRPMAEAALGYYDTGRTFGEIASEMRRQIGASLADAFGRPNVNIGTKAIRVHGLTGSRADVDVVPTFRLHHVFWDQSRQGYGWNEGVAIPTGPFILNFPEQHHANGMGKRATTKYRFKKIVRSLKRLRDELVEIQAIGPKQIPSFLVECLVYLVEDAHFLQEEDDRIDRVRRVVARLLEILADPLLTAGATEINGVKFLFHSSQPWTLDDAQVFAAAAYTRLVAE
jgi:hypothetical protein